ncbi:MAG: hypothetical protein AAGA81_01750 [Acidobacteriota bacterium]
MRQSRWKWVSVVGALLALLLVAGSLRVADRADEASGNGPPTAPSTGDAGPLRRAPGFLYGRVETVRASYEGRIRFGGVQEAFWTDTFDAFKKENPWQSFVDPEALIDEEPVEVFGVSLGTRKRPVNLRRPFRVAFGDIVALEPEVSNLFVELKSGATLRLDRMGADDFGDGLRVWDADRGVVDLDELSVRRIEFLAPPPMRAPRRLYGTVRSSAGEFTGFIQWDREASVDTDPIVGRSDEGSSELSFGQVRRVERTADGSLWSLRDGRRIELTGTRSVGSGHRGVAVTDERYGRAVVGWSSFESLDLREAGSGPGYESFAAGGPLRGRVTLIDDSTLEGRLVYDLDESETTDTLDVSRGDVDYALRLSDVAVIEPRHDVHCATPPRVTLRGGQTLELDCSGDLAPTHAGVLVFRGETPTYAAWSAVRLVELFDTP